MIDLCIYRSFVLVKLGNRENMIAMLKEMAFIYVICFQSIFSPCHAQESLNPQIIDNHVFYDARSEAAELSSQNDELSTRESSRSQQNDQAQDESSLGSEDEEDLKQILIVEPHGKDLENLLLFIARDEFKEEMRHYIVGIKGQPSLITLEEAYNGKVLSPPIAGLLLYKLQEARFNDGEIGAFKMDFEFGLGRRGEDIIIGRFPRSLISRPLGNEAFQPGDPSLAPFVKWLEIVGHLTWVKPLQAGSSHSINTSTNFGYRSSLGSLAASIHGNYYNDDSVTAVYGGAYASGMGVGASAGVAGANATHGVWYSILNGWQGLGYTSLYNMEEQQLGLSALGVGAFVAGWKSYVQFGATLSAVFAHGNQVGLGGVISLSKDRVTSYLKKYSGEFDPLIDSFVASYEAKKKALLEELKVSLRLSALLKERNVGLRLVEMDADVSRLRDEIKHIDRVLRRYRREKSYFKGKHFIEVRDSKSRGFRAQGGAYVSGFGVGFRASKSKGIQNIHRFYAPLDRASELLKDGNGDKIALLRLGKEFDTRGFPNVLRPHTWHVGEEVITTIERTFNGSIVMGVGQIPGFDAKVGLSSTVTGAFEIGVRKLPANKLMVSIRPSEITELGAFVSTLNVMGPQISDASTVALAMRQTFIFNLDSQKAIDTYMLMMAGGVLPLDFSKSTDVVGPREAENLLDAARIAKRHLEKKGIFLSYLEKIDVPAKKFYMGVAKVPLVSQKRWAGLSNEYLTAQAKVISTNAELAVSRNTSFVEKVQGRGRSGIRTYTSYATIKRVYEKMSAGLRSKNLDVTDDRDVEDGFLWRFKGLVIRARVSDSKIIGNEHQEIIDMLNSKFHANIVQIDKDSRGHKQSRDILLERELTAEDLDLFSQITPSITESAARGSGLDRQILEELLSKLENHGHNQMAYLLKVFIGQHGLKGVSAIHLLLNGSCRNLIVRTESNAYSDPIKVSKELEVQYSSTTNHNRKRVSKANVAHEDENVTIDLGYYSSKRQVNRVYKEIRDAIAMIDEGLRDLEDDTLFESPEDLLQFGSTNLREKKMNLRSTLIASKNRLLYLLDLEKQGFDKSDILKIYRNLRKQNRSTKQRYTLLAEEYNRPLSIHESRSNITKRWLAVSDLLLDIDLEMQDLEHENNRQILGDIFVTKEIRRLNRLKRKTEKLIDLSHFSIDDKTLFIVKMQKSRALIFSAKSIHFKIAGNADYAHRLK